jgi:hypothetical protein
MINYFVCAVSVWVLMGLLSWIHQETSKRWVEKLCESIIRFPFRVLLVLLGASIIAVMYPLIFLWRFFRNAIKGVSIDCWKKARIEHFLKFGQLRVCYDPEARRLINRLYLVRIVKPAEKIMHNPTKK